LSSGEKRRLGRPADPAKRGAIVAAAARSFFEHGYAASTIEGIAADAGVSKVTVYNQFGDKRGLFTAAIDSECAKIRQSFSLDDANGGTLEERLTGIGRDMVAFLSRDEMTRFEVRIAAETEHEPAIGLAFLDAGPRRMKLAFAGWIEAMVDAGELDVPDPMLAAEQFAGMCKGFGDLERRFGAGVDSGRDHDRIAGAVTVFLRAYRRTV
jgi:TetR/AcrR family transcriptional regulator, mexJK operon transcriptional repressor